jgi:hypothetical protein
VEGAPDPQHITDLVVLHKLAQVTGAAVDLIAGAPRRPRVIGDQVGEKVLRAALNAFEITFDGRLSADRN